MSRQVAVGVLAILLAALAPVGARSSAPCPDEAAPTNCDEFVEVDEMPVVAGSTAPDYPDAARTAGVSGTTFVRAHVDEAGRVDFAEKEKALPPMFRGSADAHVVAALDVAARTAVKGWTFKPARRAGRAVPAWVTVPVTFTGDARCSPVVGGPRPEVMPRLLTWVEPAYPYVARWRGVRGTVTVRALVGTNGRVRAAKVAVSVPDLDRAALEAVKRWTFEPARSGGRAVEAWLDVPVRFPPERGRQPVATPLLRPGDGPMAASGGEAEPLS